MFATKTFVMLSAVMISHGEAESSNGFVGLMSRLSSAFGGDGDYNDYNDDRTALGTLPPLTGGEGQPCRNTPGNECNRDLYCHYTTDGSAIFGKCQRHQQSQGGEGELCRSQYDHHGRCDSGLTCTEKTLLGPSPQRTVEICTRSSPTPDPTPQPGDMNGKCNNYGRKCNHSNLRPHYQQVLGPNAQNYVCICELFLGSTDGSTVDTSSPTLGVVAPEMGTEGNPCRNGYNGEAPCNYGLECKYYTRGSATFGTCERSSSSNTGGLNQKCNRHGDKCNSWNLQPVITNEHLYGQAFSVPVCRCQYQYGLGESSGASYDSNDASNDKDFESAESDEPTLGVVAPDMGCESCPCRNGNNGDEPCDRGLYCHYTTDGSAMFGTCKRSHNDQRGGVDEKCYEKSQKCEPGLIPEYTHLPGQALAYPVCYCREPMLGETEEKDNSTPLGALPPDFGKEGQACRNQKGNECDPGFYCKYTTDGSAIFGTCQKRYTPDLGREGQPCRNKPGNECDPGLWCHYTTDGSAIFGTCEESRRPVFAQKGDPCGYYAKAGEPRTCDYGLYCKTTNLLGCRREPCTTAYCTEYPYRTEAGSAPTPGN